MENPYKGRFSLGETILVHLFVTVPAVVMSAYAIVWAMEALQGR